MCGWSTVKATQAQSVPMVPGATGESPLPKPSAIKCAGCETKKRQVGLRGAVAIGGFGIGCEFMS